MNIISVHAIFIGTNVIGERMQPLCERMQLTTLFFNENGEQCAADSDTPIALPEFRLIDGSGEQPSISILTIVPNAQPKTCAVARTLDGLQLRDLPSHSQMFSNWGGNIPIRLFFMTPIMKHPLETVRELLLIGEQIADLLHATRGYIGTLD